MDSPNLVPDLEGITGAALPPAAARLRELLEVDLGILGQVPAWERIEELSGPAGVTPRLAELVLADLLLRHRLAEPAHPLLLLRRLAAEGMAVARVRLAMAYLRGEGVEADPVRGAARLHALAEEGVLGAAYHLAGCYEKGHGVPESAVHAAAWYRVGVEAGHREAMTALGLAYLMGRGVEVELPQALRLLWRGVEKDSDWAVANLGPLLFRGHRASDGTVELDPDPRRAVPLLRRAADRGLRYHQLLLGDCYHVGKGVEEDQARAYEWYRRAADQDLPEARYMVAWLLLRGRGVTPDLDEAIRQLEGAANLGHPGSCYQLGILVAHGRGVPRDAERTVRLFARAAEAGHAEAEKALLAARSGASLPPPRGDAVLPAYPGASRARG